MAGTFKREDAKILHVFYPQNFTGPLTIYRRQPLNLITYDGEPTTQFIEPVSDPALSDMTANDAEGYEVKPTVFITQTPIAAEVFELH